MDTEPDPETRRGLTRRRAAGTGRRRRSHGRRRQCTRRLRRRRVGRAGRHRHRRYEPACAAADATADQLHRHVLLHPEEAETLDAIVARLIPGTTPIPEPARRACPHSSTTSSPRSPHSRHLRTSSRRSRSPSPVRPARKTAPRRRSSSTRSSCPATASRGARHRRIPTAKGSRASTRWRRKSTATASASSTRRHRRRCSPTWRTASRGLQEIEGFLHARARGRLRRDVRRPRLRRQPRPGRLETGRLSGCPARIYRAELKNGPEHKRVQGLRDMPP